MKVKMVEVGPRDGLQNESQNLSPTVRREFIEKLVKAGLRHIEIGAFVSPQKVPQMASSKELITELIRDQKKNKNFAKGVQFSALVPNEKGMQDALTTGITEIAVFTAASETFTKKNINCTIDESIERFRPVVKLAKANKVRVRAYVSTCFGCPYEGEIKESQVMKVVAKLQKLGFDELSIGDTIGVADPLHVRRLVKRLLAKVEVKKLAMHFHDTRGTALVNIFESLEQGVRIFDSSLGGLGGCPYAPGASGNVATEDVIYMHNRMGVNTGVDLKSLVEITHWMSSQLQRKLPSKLSGTPLLKR